MFTAWPADAYQQNFLIGLDSCPAQSDTRDDWQKMTRAATCDGQYEGRTHDLGVISTTL